MVPPSSLALKTPGRSTTTFFFYLALVTRKTVKRSQFARHRYYDRMFYGNETVQYKFTINLSYFQF